MMKSNFEKYVLDWFHDFAVEHDEEVVLLELFNAITGRENEPIEDWLGEEESLYDYLQNYDDADSVYRNLFFIQHDFDYVKLPDKNEFVLEMLKESVHEAGLDEYDFVEEFIEDMVDHITCYDNPHGFFKDLMHRGCISSMIGMLIYNSDCMKIYSEHCIDMEKFKEDFEEELGEPIRQREDRKTYHYTWMCWLCYEETAFRIARHLWEDDF